MNLLSKINMQKLRAITRIKRPRTKHNYVGIEIEFISKLDHTALRNLFIKKNLHKYVYLKFDGSIIIRDYEYIQGYKNVHELCILVKEKELTKVVKKVCAVLEDNSTINSTCGLHVHIDMRNFNPKIAYANLFLAQDVLYGMCHPSRYDNGYSDYVDSYEPFDEYSEDDGRYVGINKSSYQRHRTIEVRIHQGTIKANQIINWTKLLIKIARNGVNKRNWTDVSKPIANLNQFKRKFKPGKRIWDYVKDRVKVYKESHLNTNTYVLTA